jgi:hypothetical protein
MPELQMLLALRFNCSYFYLQINILDKAGIYLKSNPLDPNKESQEIDDMLLILEAFGRGRKQSIWRNLFKHSLQELNELLDQAVSHEDYEKPQD